MPDTNQGPAAGAPAAAGLRWVETKTPITRRADELDAHRKVLDDFEKAHLEESNSTGGPISITRRDFAKLRGALKICIKRMCEYCRADAAHSMPGKECVEGCETLRLVKKALGEEEDDHA